MGGIGEVMVLQESPELELERVAVPNVVVEGVDGIADGGTVEGVHGVEIVIIPNNRWLVRGGAIASQRSGKAVDSSIVAVNDVLDSPSLGEASTSFVSVAAGFRV